MVQNGITGLTMVLHGSKWSKMCQNCSYLFIKGQKWLKIVYYSLIWCNICLQNYQNWPDISRSNGLVYKKKTDII